ncbi:MAG TPA: D-glycero-beta-D-manno-heptose-7-phosphate kinase [Bryobacteraceae bacterium]|nr:D-glycero-beta-D-manno-heptose-7-phosphate kinase [Bryobacteraceae bacterium]
MMITKLLMRAPTVRVLVAGDCMLDAYISGSATRISPEAPVAVVEVSERKYVLGGAANVAANACGMGAKVKLAGVTGVDEAGSRIRGELTRLGIGMEALIEDDARVTTTKTRVTAGGQQIVRFDEENRLPLSARMAAQLLRKCEQELDDADVVVISDYAKGVAPESFCRWVIERASKRGIPVVVDPKSADLTRYRGARIVTPNLREAAAASDETIRTNEDLARAADKLLAEIAPSGLLITRGADGMSLFEPGHREVHLPAMTHEVADVTGAGDTVVATLAVALGAGFDLRESAEMANLAAGVAVGHHGTWAVKRDELIEASRLRG